ncbi:hypothetical protein EJ03DRAFT_147049 [Teratosphaeria nubilosa]|uniref:Uncharacterized protein n=1 Tax=Teratosphaeria nubilosa TaxID=161662 RepID=A0A6G1L3S2_9PEZI|nr:hypothetical protein EJ03DRAFT_147049 [Teratosphaeria nubilosa]
MFSQARICDFASAARPWQQRQHGNLYYQWQPRHSPFHDHFSTAPPGNYHLQQRQVLLARRQAYTQRQYSPSAVPVPHFATPWGSSRRYPYARHNIHRKRQHDLKMRSYMPPALLPAKPPASTTQHKDVSIPPPASNSQQSQPSGPPPGYAQISQSNDPRIRKAHHDRLVEKQSLPTSESHPKSPSHHVSNATNAKAHSDRATRRAIGRALGKGDPSVYFPGWQAGFGWHDDGVKGGCRACGRMMQTMQRRYGVRDLGAVAKVHERMLGR